MLNLYGIRSEQPRRAWLIGSAVLITLWGAGLLPAQTTTAIISGTVTDASGAVVAGAKVDVRNVGTGITRSTTSNGQGRYRVPELLIGDYEVQASQAGFQTVLRKGITVTVGSEAVIDLSLPVGQAQQTVTVEAQASQVDTSSAAVATLVEPTQMNELPLNGRNFEQLLTLAPGVQTIPASGGGFYGRQDNYSVAGSRPVGQAFMVDNQNLLSFFGHATGSGSAGTTLGLEAIAEFQTLTNTYSSQFGGNGAVINAASKSGTNGFHGSIYEFLRNSAMDDRSPFDTYIKPGNTSANPPEYRRNQFGGSLGGPIKKDKAFFFVNYEGLRAEQGVSSITPNVPDVNAHQGYLPCSVAGAAFASSCNPATNLAFVGLPASVAPIMALFPSVAASPTGLGSLTEVANNITHENYFLARFDYNLSDKDSIFARYIRDYALYLTPLNGSSLALFPEADNTANNFATVEERHIFSPTLVNLARVSFTRPVETAVQDTPQVPALEFVAGQPNGRVAVAGTTIGPFMLLPYYLVPNHFVEGDDIIWTHGSHNIRAGVSVERVEDNTSSPQALGGTYTFSSLLTFLEAQPASVSVPLLGQTDSFRELRTTFLTPYIHDEWKIAKRLTLNLGLRYEFATDPTDKQNLLHNLDQFSGGVTQGTGLVSVPNAFGRNITTRNWAPRVGFAYDPFADHKTSIRGGFGIFYDMLTGRDILPAYWLAPPYNLGTANGTVAFPNPFAGSVNPPLPSLAQGLYYWAGSTPMVMQYNLNLQRELSQGMVLTVGYTGSRGEHLLLTREYNAPELINGAFGTALPNGNTAPNVRLNPGLSALSVRDTVGNSNYNALIVSLNRRFARRWQTQVSYTYSKALDNGSAGQGAEGGPAAPQLIMNPYNAATDYARSSFDRTQSIRVSAVYDIPGHGYLLGGWMLTGLLTRATGAPLSILDGFDRTGLGGNNIRPNFAPGVSSVPVLGTPSEYFNPTVFALSPVGTFGSIGRDTLIGPALADLDTALVKNTPIKKVSEVFNVQFRAEVFNLANHPNWGQPGNSIFLNGAGANGTLNPSAGRITSILGNARQIQLALKVVF